MRRLKIERRACEGPITELRISMPPFQITLRIQAPSSMRVRRSLALHVFRQVKPALQILRDPEIVHLDGHSANWLWNGHRPISLHQTSDLAHEAGRAGYSIRTRRLILGLTQEQLAKAAGIHRSQLSLIEKGRVLPRRRTLFRLEKSLKHFAALPTKGNKKPTIDQRR